MTETAVLSKFGWHCVVWRGAGVAPTSPAIETMQAVRTAAEIIVVDLEGKWGEVGMRRKKRELRN
jgi:hypothetical protein